MVCSQRTEAQVGIIYNQILHLGRLVNDLWTLTRAETGSLPLEKRSVDIKQVLEETVYAFSALAQDEQIDLRLEAQPALQPLTIDTGRVATGILEFARERDSTHAYGRQNYAQNRSRSALDNHPCARYRRGYVARSC